jgi:DsbC/DsbD-like thiol-disulfide interchange protein
MRKLQALTALWLLSAQAAAPRAEVRHDDNLCLAYQAALEGDYLVVRAAIEPGWHTFAMDNEHRAKEKLAGRMSLGIDRQTEIRITGGLSAAGPWYQTPPKDFSKPELRWFSWGFEREAVFAVKVRRGGDAAGKIQIKGQACTETTCKNIDVELPAPAGRPKSGVAPAGLLEVKK